MQNVECCASAGALLEMKGRSAQHAQKTKFSHIILGLEVGYKACYSILEISVWEDLVNISAAATDSFHIGLQKFV
jgi:hypothetical protein